MADRYRPYRPTGVRQPLREVPNQANAPSTRRSTIKTVQASSPQSLPYSASDEPDGTPKVHGSPRNSTQHKRLSQVVEGDDRNSKRNSAISTTSTTASGRKRKTYIGHWQLGKTIGKGGCSRVRAVRHKGTKQHGAVKIIGRAMAENTRAQSLAHLVDNAKGFTLPTSDYKPIPFGLEREIAIMKLLEHENIVRLYDVWENRAELYLIMEYVEGGELFHYVEQRRGLPEDESIYIFRQIVSALLYCHRLNICHRDLKPENILLNTNTLAVKIIDFGMAALQPQGRLLSTPCGSPHYAAPEVVSGKPYDGRQADVWSSGVILYVMLTGTTPFNYSQDGDIRQLFRDISIARYHMPQHLSFEAQDLVGRIFVPQPKRRITMDGTWDHALMHKYDEQFEFKGPRGSKEAAIGPIPTLEDWTVKRSHDIDRDILRNMRTLWHSEPEERLMQKLTNEDINQEKLFYAALLKHQEENLENYCGEVETIGYSASDYHHIKPLGPPQAPPLPGAQQRSQSAYSILNDEHLRPSHSFVEPPPSVSSYDPYRASRDPIVDAKGEYVSVVLHRNGTNKSRRSGPQRNIKHSGTPLRVEVLKNGKRTSVTSASSSSLARRPKSRSSIRRSSMSQQSLTGSVWPSSPPGVIAAMRPSDVHKRNVSFSHLRRSSTVSAIAHDGSTKTPKTVQLSPLPRPVNPALPLSSSPGVPTQPALRSKKEKTSAPQTPQIRVRHPIATSQSMRSEIRKHSVELEKACEEAFFRASADSSGTDPSAFTDKPIPYDTPPSSVSGMDFKDTPDLQLPKTAPRPLPDMPKDTPNTYLARTLEETREKLAAFQTTGDDENAERFNEVLRMLENIMPASRLSQERRAFSAPGPKISEEAGTMNAGGLPMISEESSDYRISKDVAGYWYRSVTSPIPGQYEKPPEPNKTVRLVPPTSPGTPAPLNVRKRSPDATSRSQSSCKPGDCASHARQERPHSTISNYDEGTAARPTQQLRKKSSAWHGLKKTLGVNLSEGSLPKDFVKDKQEKVSLKRPASTVSSEFPKRDQLEKLPRKKGLARLFHRMRQGESTEIDEQKQVNPSFDSLFSTNSPTPSSGHQGAPPAPPTSLAERSWFNRFLHIKPAVRILCFNIPRRKLRSELVILMKEWQRHGIHDFAYSRETNTITARVDKVNSLDIKPVTFRIELFVVLEHGKKVGLSIARLIQVKGAKSAFLKVVEVIDGVCKGRGWLIEDEVKRKALCDIVGG
ncbi:Pkinase-domain-containing protein [Polychaeton citri CBS 116435]|uniref:non-specific serine/threonine protein kinase n=1 Tax=Polychaeton citri CBS 116435 TaxID=1314669 RepID=A0A9P4Q7R3_9PEZI|nr:Pkinase-domain-containing protein [Polychaeton citri CBS 116435]